MKRYVHAAAQDIHPKKGRRVFDRQQVEEDKEAARQLLTKAASIASDMLGREVVIESVECPDMFKYPDFVWVQWSMPDADNGEFQPYIFSFDHLVRTPKQVATDQVDLINDLRTRGKLIYKDEADALYAQLHSLIGRISEIVDAMNQKYDSDITLEADPMEETLKSHGSARILVTGNYVGDCNIIYGESGGYGLYRGFRIPLPSVMAWISRRDLLNHGPEYIENDAKRGLTAFFKDIEQQMEEIDAIVDNGDRFESDVENFCDDFTRAYIGRYPGLEVTYSIEIPSETERIYKPMVLRAILEVHCYNDEIAFRMEYTYDEWYQTDIAKKIVNAIKYRKRRDGIQ